MIDTLYEFLLGLIPLKASAVLIIDEAQNLPLPVLEQIRILSNLETDKEKLLQIVLVGQLNLETLLRAPELRQLDQRVSIRYRASSRSTGMGWPRTSRIGWRLPADRSGRIHGPRARGGAPTDERYSATDQPDLRSGAAGWLLRVRNRITPEMVVHAADSLDVQPSPRRRFAWRRARVSMHAAAAVVLAASSLAVGASALGVHLFAGIQGCA